MRYLLRIRRDDDDEWGQPEDYDKRKERDRAASLARIICGFRTHSYEQSESKSKKN